MNSIGRSRVDPKALHTACTKYSTKELGHTAICLYYQMVDKYESLGCPSRGLDISLEDMCNMLRLSPHTKASAKKARDELVRCGLIKYRQGLKPSDGEGIKGNVKFRHILTVQGDQHPDPNTTAPLIHSPKSTNPASDTATPWVDTTSGNPYGINL